MCIIVYKPKKVPMPSPEIMKNCFKANPDGSGFMYRADDMIHISKGYMTLEALQAAIKAAAETVNLKATDVVIHFRISTHGSVVPENCHPFPLSNDSSDLKALSIVCPRALAHNGILHEYGEFTNGETDMSDTMYFAKMLSGVKDRFIEPVMSSHAAKGSKFVYMSGAGKSVSFGMFKPKGSGLWFSNTGYLKPIPPLPASCHYSFGGHWMGNVGTYTRTPEYLAEKEKEWKEYVAANQSAANKREMENKRKQKDWCDTLEYPVNSKPKPGQLVIEDEKSKLDKAAKLKSAYHDEKVFWGC